MNNKTFFIAVAVLVVVGAVSLVSYSSVWVDEGLGVKVSDFPKTMGDWNATDIPLSERDYEILETRNLFVRDYKNSKGDSVILYVVYSENNRKVTHPPELCLTGGGMQIIEKSSIQLTDNLRAVKLVTEKGGYRQLVVYWFKAGSLNTNRYIRQQLKVVLDLLRGRRSSCALIRLTADIKDNNQRSAAELIRAFSRQIEPLLVKYVP